MKSLTSHKAAPVIARQFTAALDTAFFRALCEPARIDLLAALIAQGPADINALAQAVPQDRSVVSRHLKILEEAGLLISSKEGRRRVYRVQGGFIVAHLTQLLERARSMVKACC